MNLFKSKMFDHDDAGADTNTDGLVSKAFFSKLLVMAVGIPILYGYSPADVDLYKTEQKKEQARQKMIDSNDLDNTGHHLKRVVSLSISLSRKALWNLLECTYDPMH